MKTVVKLIFGSQLYGTNTPESDTDYKGIFLPSKREILLGTVPRSLTLKTNDTREKNSQDDVDSESYSLHYFIHLACQGETVALDMLHAPEEMILEKSHIWEQLVTNREKFYTKNLKAFIGYARAQASKYGTKGVRLETLKTVVNWFEHQDQNCKLMEIWDFLPLGKHVTQFPASLEHNNLRIYSVAGRHFHETCTIGYMLPSLKLMLEKYGARAHSAADAGGVDWKALSHAVRVVLEVKELLTEGTITFPLRSREHLKDVKTGKVPFDTVSRTLDSLMEEVEELMTKSTLPEKVDRRFWDNFLLETLEEEIFRKE